MSPMSGERPVAWRQLLAVGVCALAGGAVALILLVNRHAPRSGPGSATATDHRLAGVQPHADSPRPSALDAALVHAAEQGDTSRLSALIARGAGVNAAVPGIGSPLITAAQHGRVAAARALLDAGADPDLVVPGEGSPLIAAAREGSLEVMQLLLDRGASIEHVAPGHENALIQASGAGQLAAVRLLVSRGADVNARVWVELGWTRPNILRQDGEWRTALTMAERGGHAQVARYLRSAGARF